MVNAQYVPAVVKCRSKSLYERVHNHTCTISFASILVTYYTAAARSSDQVVCLPTEHEAERVAQGRLTPDHARAEYHLRRAVDVRSTHPCR